MVGAVYTDPSRAWPYFFPFPEWDPISSGATGCRSTGETYIEPTVVEMTALDWQAFLRQGDLVETEVLAQHKDGSLYKAIARKSQRQIDQQSSWNVMRRDGFMCRYCGEENLPLTMDHLVRWEDGGPSIEANMVSACRPCNKIRGDTAYAAWLRHPYYTEKSSKLSIAIRERNLKLADTLADIPRKPVVRDR